MIDLTGNEIIETEAKEILPDAGRAHLVHGEILAGKKQVAIGLYEFAAGLKTMRDERLYQALGCAGFDEYCEKLAKVNVSQAYKYITILAYAEELREKGIDIEEIEKELDDYAKERGIEF